MDSYKRPSREVTPGMEEVIQAGDSMEIQDREGQTFVVTAREHEKTIAFLDAFDQWLIAKEKVTNKPLLDTYYAAVIATFYNLPNHILRQLPSYKTRGVILPGHQHG